MTDFYLYLSSLDSLNIRKNNNPGECFIQFPKSYELDGVWTCALTQISLTCNFTPRSKRLYLCCDLIQDSYVRNTSLPVLRNIEIETRYKKLQTKEYVNPEYIPVTVNHFNSLHIYLRDENLNSVNFTTNDLHCVVHFKKSWAR